MTKKTKKKSNVTIVSQSNVSEVSSDLIETPEPKLEPEKVTTTEPVPSLPKEIEEELLLLRKQLKHYDDFVKQLKYYDEFAQKTSNLQMVLSDAESVLRNAKEEVKECRATLINHFKSMKKPYDSSKFPLLETEKMSQNTNEIPQTSTDISKTEIDVPETQKTEEWKTWLAKEHFNFTENEWEILAPSEGTADKMTIWNLVEVEQRLNRGDKIKGFGDKKREKLSDQFLEFWEKHPEFCIPKPDKTDDFVANTDVDETDNTEDTDNTEADTEADTNINTESDTDTNSDTDTKTDDNSEFGDWNYSPQKEDKNDDFEKPSPLDVQIFLEEIQNLLDDERYEVPSDTLQGIYDNVKEYRSYTEDQKIAVENIKAGFEDHVDRD